jgi:hypothetical protein
LCPLAFVVSVGLRDARRPASVKKRFEGDPSHDERTMSRKGRRGRSNRPKASGATATRAVERSPAVRPSCPPQVSPPVPAVSFDTGPAGDTSGAAPSEPVEAVSQATQPAETKATDAAAPPVSEAADAPEPSVPPASDLDVRFFDELPAESWLAHELELRDPRFVLKMTEGVARRRARLVKYVAGVVAVSAALCVAALVKAAVPIGDDDGALPASRPTPAASPFAPVSGDSAVTGEGRVPPAGEGD